MTLEEFARAGTLGDIRFGATRAVVRGILGEPEAWSSSPRKKNEPLLWKYRDLQMAFLSSELVFLGFYFRGKVLHLPKGIGRGKLGIRVGMKKATILRLLDRLQIPHQPYPALTLDDQSAVKVGPGITVVFDDAQRIDSMQFMAK